MFFVQIYSISNLLLSLCILTLNAENVWNMLHNWGYLSNQDSSSLAFAALKVTDYYNWFVSSCDFELIRKIDWWYVELVIRRW